MLPLNEPYFEINANTRDIIIPAEFKKLVAVAGDHIAETLVFSIDRFFDANDLLTTNILAQWVDANGEHKIDDLTEIKYYDAKNQKIIFGWPLSNKITKTNRTIEFSIRFTRETNGEINYSFNTQTHKITVAPALKADIEGIEKENVSNYFLNAITNSPSTDAPPAAEPYFNAPGLNLDNEADLIDGVYTLEVQAVKNGMGNITYDKWMYQNANGEVRALDGGKEIFKEIAYDADDLITQYYIKSTDVPETYIPWYRDDNLIEEDIPQLYERYYTYEVKYEEGNSIIGKYWTTAQNQTSNNISKKVESNKCSFYGVSELNYAENGDLATDMTIDENNNSLKVNINTNEKNSLSYKWFVSEESDEDGFIVIDNENTSELEVTEPGWYYVTTTATRNGDSDNIDSNKCRVVNEPESVIVKSFNANPAASDTMQLIVELEEFDKPEKLYSDMIEYHWFGSVVNSGTTVEITESNRETYRVISESLDKNTLLVVNPDEVANPGVSAISYYCMVINVLNNKKSTPVNTSPKTIQ